MLINLFRSGFFAHCFSLIFYKMYICCMKTTDTIIISLMMFVRFNTVSDVDCREVNSQDVINFQFVTNN